MLTAMVSCSVGYFIYRQRLANRGADGNEDEAHLITSASTERIRSATMMSSIRGNLRLCRRIPSPNISREWKDAKDVEAIWFA